jgi:hypothetical protein
VVRGGLVVVVVDRSGLPRSNLTFQNLSWTNFDSQLLNFILGEEELT